MIRAHNLWAFLMPDIGNGLNGPSSNRFHPLKSARHTESVCRDSSVIDGGLFLLIPIIRHLTATSPACSLVSMSRRSRTSPNTARNARASASSPPAATVIVNLSATSYPIGWIVNLSCVSSTDSLYACDLQRIRKIIRLLLRQRDRQARFIAREFHRPASQKLDLADLSGIVA